MQKIKVEDMACFEQVAKVIGKANAKRELEVVMQICHCDAILPLDDSFVWRKTPQKSKFWRDINRGINPCK
jgi:hypothetical protein